MDCTSSLAMELFLVDEKTSNPTPIRFMGPLNVYLPTLIAYMSNYEFQFAMGPNYIYHEFHPFIKVNLPYSYKSHGSDGTQPTQDLTRRSDGC